MTITASDIKIGMCVEMDGKTFIVVDFQHCKPGKGPAFVRSKLKNLENGNVLDKTFSSVSQKATQCVADRHVAREPQGYIQPGVVRAAPLLFQ